MIATENNYEYITFYHKGKVLSNIKKVRIEGQTFEVQPVLTSRSYPDHGKVYTSTFQDYKLCVEVNGVEFENLLSTLICQKKVKVEFID